MLWAMAPDCKGCAHAPADKDVKAIAPRSREAILTDWKDIGKKLVHKPLSLLKSNLEPLFPFFWSPQFPLPPAARQGGCGIRWCAGYSQFLKVVSALEAS